MPDVRKMSDEDLLDQYFDYGWQSTRDELSRRLGIMRELCRSVAADDKFTELGADRFVSAIQAFRRMEAEHERP